MPILFIYEKLEHFFLSMPRIVNGQIVNDEPTRREPEKNRIRTWNDITNAKPTSHGESNSVRNRGGPENKSQTKEAVLEAPPPASIPQYISHALGLEEYNVSIPPSNPLITINVAFFILFLFFTILFGYKMAVLYYFSF